MPIFVFTISILIIFSSFMRAGALRVDDSNIADIIMLFRDIAPQLRQNARSRPILSAAEHDAGNSYHYISLVNTQHTIDMPLRDDMGLHSIRRIEYFTLIARILLTLRRRA